jgi:rhamnulokinase
MAEHRYLAIDLGAESGRAMLARLSGRLLELQDLYRFPNVPVQLPGGLYWNTLGLFQEIKQGLRAAARTAGGLDGIAVDTWGVDFGLLGADGALVDNPRHYRDTRTAGMMERAFAVVPRAEIFARTGIQFMELNSLYQLYAVKQAAPWVLDAARRLLFMPDLFNYFLTGVMRAERTIASTSQFYDPAGKEFAAGLLQKLGIPPDLPGDLVEPGTLLGPLLPQIADECELARATPVFATAGHDTAAAVAAVPAAAGSRWCYISSGTWSLVGVELDAPLLGEDALAANFTNEVGVGGKIRFLKNVAGLWLLQECRRAWRLEGKEYSYEQLTAMAGAAQPSETVLDLEKFYAAGQCAQKVREYCRKTGQQIPRDDGEICRVILYSLAARYRDVLKTLEELTDRSVDVIHIVGGGSQNRLLNQLTADVTGRRVVAGPVEATAAGNGLVQALGAGELKSLDELREVVRHSFQVVEFFPKG